MRLKYCASCNEDKEVSEFGKNVSRYDGLQGRCRKCRNSQTREWYANSEHKKTHALRVKETKKRYKKDVQTRILTYLRDHPCVDCGNTDTEVLEFDHVDRSTKIKSVSSLFRDNASWDKISEEISKCEVRCCNCHRKRTIRQFGWYRLVVEE